MYLKEPILSQTVRQRVPLRLDEANENYMLRALILLFFFLFYFCVHSNNFCLKSRPFLLALQHILNLYGVRNTLLTVGISF